MFASGKAVTSTAPDLVLASSRVVPTNNGAADHGTLVVDETTVYVASMTEMLLSYDEKTMSFQGFEERSSMVVTVCDAVKISVGSSVASGNLKTW